MTLKAQVVVIYWYIMKLKKVDASARSFNVLFSVMAVLGLHREHYQRIRKFKVLQIVSYLLVDFLAAIVLL